MILNLERVYAAECDGPRYTNSDIFIFFFNVVSRTGANLALGRLGSCLGR